MLRSSLLLTRERPFRTETCSRSVIYVCNPSIIPVRLYPPQRRLQVRYKEDLSVYGPVRTFYQEENPFRIKSLYFGPYDRTKFHYLGIVFHFEYLKCEKSFSLVKTRSGGVNRGFLLCDILVHSDSYTDSPSGLPSKTYQVSSRVLSQYHGRPTPTLTSTYLRSFLS